MVVALVAGEAEVELVAGEVEVELVLDCELLLLAANDLGCVVVSGLLAVVLLLAPGVDVADPAVPGFDCAAALDALESGVVVAAGVLLAAD